MMKPPGIIAQAIARVIGMNRLFDFCTTCVVETLGESEYRYYRMCSGSISRVIEILLREALFLSKANAMKYLKLINYYIMRERAFTCEDLQGFREMVEMLQQRHWVSFNNLIREANKNIGLEFYANATFIKVATYISYVRGKYVNYSVNAINSLFNLQPPHVCALKTYRNEQQVIKESMAQEMIEAFCRPGAEWVVEHGLVLTVGVPVYPDEKMIGPKAPINASAIRRLQHHYPAEATQNDEEDNPAGNDEEFYQPQVQQQQVQMQGQQASEIQRRMEAHAVGVTR
ncbi:hypothetical protein KIW84_053339 [Lathyrus oleraceus]|uniref:Putative plant transposon protein domain-containing protein n=1 Tax=Pisum sativum TaxID=3888 RepID=A0A9D4WSQ5_PEA|nr:hypothetical protein KIW84_053339 [Pisum sativum]